MRICLINLKFEQGNITNFRKQEHTGLGYIGAVCESIGHEVNIINAQFENIEKEIVVERVKELNPELIGITVYEELLNDTICIVNEIKNVNKEIVMVAGGHYATFNAEELLQEVNGIDIVSIGEGEISFPDIVHAIDNKISLREVKGICFKDEKKIVNTGFPDAIDELDKLPYPIRAKIDRSDKLTNISSSRGCHGNCSFCSTNAFYTAHKCKKFRIRNPVKVVDEIEYIVKNYNSHHIFFTDDNFMISERLHNGWVDTFTDELAKRDLNVVFNFDCRVDDIDEGLFIKLKKVGLIGIFLGVESNSMATLRLYNKNTTKKNNIDAINTLRKLRIDYWIGNIMFHPLTTLDDIEEDIKFFEEIHYCLYFNYSNPISCLAGKLKVYKGTQLFYNLQNEGVLEVNNLECEYKFKADKVNSFYEFISVSKQLVMKMVELDPIYLLEKANKYEMLDIASKIHSTSRKFMKLDFDLFKSAHKFLKDNDSLNDFKVFSQELLERSSALADQLCGELKELKEKIDVFYVNK